jgi:hypothetical protein
MAADKITGIWAWDAESRPDPIGSIVTFVVRKGETRFGRYYGKLFASDKGAGFKVFGDRDDSKTLSSGDKYLGKMFVRNTPDYPVYSGTFKLTVLPGVASGYSLGGFIGEAYLGNWFE